MSLARNKKGIELSTLAEILLVVVATGFIIGVFTATSSQAEEKTSENLCMGFNALRFGTQVEAGPVSFNVAPRACKTLEKGDLPGKDYKNHVSGVKEGAKAEIRDMMARCWWMWLEGNQKNIFDSRWYNLQNGCFVCYTFSLGKGTETFSYNEFVNSLEAPYYAIDKSDRCAPGGQGGKCMPSCDKSSTYFSKEVASNRCKQNDKCCISDDNRDECKNKGGQCQNGPSGEFTEYNPKWACKEGACYIKKENMASYLDYIQGTKGISGGAGKVLFGDNAGVGPGQKYAVTFVSPGKNWNLNTLIGVGGTLAVGATAIVGIFSGVGTLPTLWAIKVGIDVAVIGGTSTAALAYLTGGTGEIKDTNMIVVSKYDTVASKCAIEPGVGET